MDEFIFYIDNEKIEQPEGWGLFTEELKKDESDRVLYFSFPLELTFYGEAYDMLDDKWQKNYDSTFSFVAVDNRSGIPEVVVNAVIKLSTCLFDLTKKTCQCNIDDATYQAQIFNRFSVKASPSTNETIMGKEMVGAQNIELKPFHPITGDYYPAGVLAYDIMDCIKALVSYITDDSVTVKSDWYDNLPDDQRLCITTGAILQVTTESFNPIVSLKELFGEIWRKYNLYMIVENPLNNSSIRIETYEYLYGSSQSIEINDIKNLNRTIDFDQLYNRIKLGSSNFLRDFGNEYLLPYFQFFGFSEESYAIRTDIGENIELDLMSAWIIDHNLIEEIIKNPDDTNEDDIVIIQYNKNTGEATKCDYYGVPENAALYNGELLNSVVADRFKYYGDLVLNSNIQASNFRATRTDSSTNTVEIPWPGILPFLIDDNYPYQDDFTIPNFDDGDNYNPVTSKYTAPRSGVYRFESSFAAIHVNSVQTQGSSAANDFQVYAEMSLIVNDNQEFKHDVIVCTILDNNDNIASIFLISENELRTNGINQTHEGWTIAFSGTRSLTLNEGDEVSVSNKYYVQNDAELTAFDVTITIAGLIFRTLATPGTGGVYEKRNEQEIQIGVYEKEGIVTTNEQWSKLRSHPNLKFLIDTGYNDTRVSYVKSISRKFVTGETDFELTFNREQPNI